MATIEKRAKKLEPRHPEKKWGPFAGGAGVAVWLNEFETEEGTRYTRTVTLSPRRFRDPKTNEWRDGAYRPVDLAALLLAIEAALDYCLSTPLPGEPAEPDEGDALSTGDVPQPGEETPF
jgi:hypothetical protein